MLLLRLNWALILRVVIGFGLHSSWSRPFGLNSWIVQNPSWCDLPSGSGNSPRSFRARCDRVRPAGLGFAPFWPKFAPVAPDFKLASKLLELVNVSRNHSNIAPIEWNPKEYWRWKSSKLTANSGRWGKNLVTVLFYNGGGSMVKTPDRPTVRCKSRKNGIFWDIPFSKRLHSGKRKHSHP